MLEVVQLKFEYTAECCAQCVFRHLLPFLKKSLKAVQVGFGQFRNEPASLLRHRYLDVLHHGRWKVRVSNCLKFAYPSNIDSLGIRRPFGALIWPDLGSIVKDLARESSEYEPTGALVARTSRSACRHHHDDENVSVHKSRARRKAVSSPSFLCRGQSAGS